MPNIPHVKCMRKVRIMSSRYALYGLGYTYDTMVFTMRYRHYVLVELKNYLSSD